MTTLASQLIRFYRDLSAPTVPKGFGILHPQPDAQVMKIVETFFKKYYNDTRRRVLLLGINPGRFGAGITGINFTAPRQLKNYCGIDHPWKDSSELSAEFIYELISLYGGAKKFYGDYFISAMSPLGYVKDGKNVNYYDDKRLQTAVSPFIAQTLQQQLKMGFDTHTCICIGGEKNYKYLKNLNEKHAFFKNIVALPHPRFIMQYRRKTKQAYLDEYLGVLRDAYNTLVTSM